jgi:hypothetical protein
MEKAAGAESPLHDPGQEAAKGATLNIEELREKLGDASQRILAFIKERPGVCLLGAVATGYLLGRLARSKD